MSSPEIMQQLQQLFHAALELKGEERTRFLAAACQDNPALRKEVEALLAIHENPDDFLQVPALAQMAEAPPEIITPRPTPARQISHYDILSLLGRGGMGEVYLAIDRRLGRNAALKILPPRYTTEVDLVRRFEREAKAASALNHPNILTVYEIGQADDVHYIATEFIEGETLRQRLKRAPCSLEEVLDIVVQIASALKTAHEAGIIHRDIKPENIMLRPDGYVKVLDFGLAKLTETTSSPDASSTRTGLIMGTPSYMSPEQARGQKVDARTDIWSLGVVLYEMVSDARPFSGNTQADLLVAILEREPAALPPAVAGQVQPLIARALAKDPAHRYATMQAFHADLIAWRRKVQFAAELKLSAAAEPANHTLRQPEEAVTLRLVPAAADAAATNLLEGTTPALPVDAPTSAAGTRFSARTVFASIALAGALGTASWYYVQSLPVTPPVASQTATIKQHEVAWWLTVQRRENGKLDSPIFPSAGRDWFPNGSKFKFNLISPQAGYLYLLNEGPTKGGKISLNLLYPTPANNQLNAAIGANTAIQTGNYIFNDHEGEEKFWIVWASQPIPEIEAVKTTTVQAEIQDSAQSASILNLLRQHAAQTSSQVNETTEQTLVKGNDILVHLAKLRHR